MRRRLSFLFLAITLLLGTALGGCSGIREGGYYVLRENLERQGEADSLLVEEAVTLAAAPDPLTGLISAFATQPKSRSLRSALPEEMEILSWKTESGEVAVTLSAGYEALSPMDQTVLSCALAGTLCQLEEVRSVTLLVGDEAVVRGLTADDAVFRDGEADPEERQVRLYFTDSDGRYLSQEVHGLSLGEEETSLERIVLEELFRGPFSDSLRSAVPAGTAVRSVTTEDGLCTVDLSGEFVSARADSALGQRLSVYAIVNTLTALPEVERVRILAEGEAVTDYAYLDLSRTFTENERVLGPADTAGGEVDITIYMALRDQDLLVGVPWIVRPEGESLALAACEALFTTGEDPDYRSLFHGEDSFLSVEVTESGVCRVDLPRSFFDSRGSEEEIRLAVEAITATLAGLPNITGVYLTMDGGPAKYGGLDFTGRLTPNIESIVK